MPYKKIRLILGDQLNADHSWYDHVDTSVLYVMMEMRQETDYVTHHITKVVAFFMAMRRFAHHLRQRGHSVHYITLDDPQNRHSPHENLMALAQIHPVEVIEYQLPDEYRLDRQLAGLQGHLGIPVRATDTEHFLTSRDGLASFFRGKKHYLMEHFYRKMRRKYQVLMEGDRPMGDRWNFDSENRNRLPEKVEVPEPTVFRRSAEIREIAEMLRRNSVHTIGRLNPDCWYWPVDRQEAMIMLRNFLEQGLPFFGKYQDAMSHRSATIFHSLLSFALNTKMLNPLEVVRSVEDRLPESPSPEDLAQIEGFIRQILGWREYMRGIYWAEMPEFGQLNYFGNNRPLPDFYWTGDTGMNCLRHAIGQSLEEAYAHHIQRLMITGNFAALTGIDPDEVDRWYLGIYIDAIEWVEITNTRGMSQYADGGIVGTKPYVSSGNYIKRMSDYCSGCRYKSEVKTGPEACPFNSLYWHFHHRNRHLLGANPRIAQVYRTWDRMDTGHKEELLKQAGDYLDRIETL